jgi:hypothetical protein
MHMHICYSMMWLFYSMHNYVMKNELLYKNFTSNMQNEEFVNIVYKFYRI